MSRSLYLLGILFLVFTNTAVKAQEGTGGTTGDNTGSAIDPAFEQIHPVFRDQALVLDINARVVEQNQMVTWNEVHQKITIPGRPVGIRLVGANVVVAIQFTPYFRRRGQNLLVAQGQIWMDVPNQGIRYHTSMQTIPLEFNEPVYFFPLGPIQNEDTATIEVILIMRPYRDVIPPVGTGASTGAQE
ncbi:MAG: hypothetical protein LBH97_06855 [Treponema sp.]|jgi:hypothetical protein|nr:hypothetical protein [Treponema sp.]